MNTLITSCLNRHAALKRVKVTRQPAPWMKELDIKALQQECQNLHIAAHRNNTEQTRGLFRNARNRLKTVIKETRWKISAVVIWRGISAIWEGGLSTTTAKQHTFTKLAKVTYATSTNKYECPKLR